MGSLYKRKVREANGEWKELPTWWLKYYQNGRAVRESSSTKSERVARRMLRVREGDVERGIPVNPKMDRFMFEEAAQDLIHDYEANGKKSIRVLKQRIVKHLAPFFQGRRMAMIRPTDIRAYVVARQRSVIVTGRGKSRRERHPANGEINRELTTLKRMFSLAVESEKLVRRPHIPLLAEAPARKGFFDRDQVGAICGHLPSPVAAVVRFGYLTGWRIDSEVLTLQWSNIDWKGQQVRLDAGTAKFGEPRVFPFTDELEALLTQQRDEQARLQRQGRIVPWVFHREGKPIKSFIKAWRSACRAAGCPGRIPHDLRRTAVRNLERAGVPRSTAMAMVGHKTESIYRRYAIVDEAMTREAAAKLNNYTRGHTSGHSQAVNSPTGGPDRRIP